MAAAAGEAARMAEWVAQVTPKGMRQRPVE
jgi:hypothetical protein